MKLGGKEIPRLQYNCYTRAQTTKGSVLVALPGQPQGRQLAKPVMNRHTLPSPAPTKAELLPAGFHELIQHNASASYPCGMIRAESVQVHSQPASRYGTPGPHSLPHHPQGVDSPMDGQHCGGASDLVGRQPQIRRVPVANMFDIRGITNKFCTPMLIALTGPF